MIILFVGHAHSECSVLIGLGQHRACNTKYCKLEALYYRGGEKWTVELTCATECTNVTTNDLYYIFTMSCCSLSTCVWNQEDNVIFMNGQIPAPKVTSTTTLVSLTPSSTTPPSIIILPSVSPSTTPKSYNSFMKAMRKIPICESRTINYQRCFLLLFTVVYYYYRGFRSFHNSVQFTEYCTHYCRLLFYQIP